MKKDIIVHLTSVEANTTLASVNIALFLADTLNVPIVDSAESAAEMFGKRGVVPGKILLVNGPPAFCSWREELALLVSECDTLAFVQNDYTIYPPSQVNKVMRERGWVNEKTHVKPPHRWTTIPDKGGQYLNWNCLPMLNAVKFKFVRKHDGVLYWGAYRDGRKDYFEKFFGGARRKGKYPIHVSSSAQAGKKFFALNPHIKLHKPMLPLITGIKDFKATIYIEDEYSHKHYCSPANRFYEGLAAGLAILVHCDSVPTLLQAGYDIEQCCPDAIVNSKTDVFHALSKWRSIAVNQRTAFYDIAMGEVKALRRRVRKLYREM